MPLEGHQVSHWLEAWVDLSPGRLGEREGVRHVACPTQGRGLGRQDCERLGQITCIFTQPTPSSCGPD